MDRERVVCAYARPASGPGWANSPIWYVWRDDNGKLHEECIQPREQSAGMRDWYAVATIVNERLRAECERHHNGE